MSNPTDIEAIEARLKSAGVTVADFCERAAIHRATWQRWKKAGGNRPNWATWDRVLAQLAEIEARTAA
jgi:hypothetical protein